MGHEDKKKHTLSDCLRSGFYGGRAAHESMKSNEQRLRGALTPSPGTKSMKPRSQPMCLVTDVD